MTTKEEYAELLREYRGCDHINVFNRDDIGDYFIPESCGNLVFVCPDCNGFVVKEDWENRLKERENDGTERQE